MNNIILPLLLSLSILGFSNIKSESTINEQKPTCFQTDKFNLVAKFISDNGEQILLSKRLIAGKNTSTLEISLGSRFLELQKYQDHFHIIVIDKREKNKLPPYFVSNKDNKIETSAYNSRVDMESDINNRKADWCSIISEIEE